MTEAEWLACTDQMPVLEFMVGSAPQASPTKHGQSGFAWERKTSGRARMRFGSRLGLCALDGGRGLVRSPVRWRGRDRARPK